MIPMEYCIVGHILTAMAKSYTLSHSNIATRNYLVISYSYIKWSRNQRLLWNKSTCVASAFSCQLWHEQKRWLICLVIQHSYGLRLILSSCFSDGAEGCWFSFSSDKKDLCILARVREVVDQERGQRCDYPWVSIRGEKREKVPAELENERLWPHQTCGSISSC